MCRLAPLKLPDGGAHDVAAALLLEAGAAMVAFGVGALSTANVGYLAQVAVHADHISFEATTPARRPTRPT